MHFHAILMSLLSNQNKNDTFALRSFKRIAKAILLALPNLPDAQRKELEKDMEEKRKELEEE